MSAMCCQVDILHWADHSSRKILPSVTCLTQCDHEASKMRRPWPTMDCHAIKTKLLVKIVQWAGCYFSTAWCNTDTGTEQSVKEGPYDLLGRNCCDV